MTRFLAPLLTLVLSLLPLLNPASAAAAEHYLCGGDPLSAEVYAGAVDASDIPNSAGGTVPGAFVVLEWRGVSLQLPRTNNAGGPSYTDGRWWWQASDPEHPDFAQRRGEIEHYTCERSA